ncbi:type IX secretion system sortase PorU [Bacteroidia bacterium]|nr:type IX secretion system sortase PorU [Bacteroidia bacterium]MDC1395359.1 type IX secretion system sortase PorU [Bacteroidia bacterium]
MTGKKKIIYIALIFILNPLYYAAAQSSKQHLSWNINPTVTENPEIRTYQILTPYSCNECYNFTTEKFSVPYISKTINGDNIDVVGVRIINTESSISNSTRLHSNLSSDYKIEQKITYERGHRRISFVLTPLRKAGNATEYLNSFEWDYTTIARAQSSFSSLKKKKDQTYTSVLSTGKNYKISIPNDGVYKITSAFLDGIGVSLNEVSLSKFKIYGNGGEMLPELIKTERPEDLQENAIYVHDVNNNDKMDENDYVLWYANGPTKFNYSAGSQTYIAIGHDFDIASYFFINWEGKNGKRVNTLPSGEGSTPSATITQYDHLIYHESNEENHIKSGRKYWGDKMQITKQKNFEYNVPGVKIGKTASFRTITAGRSYDGFSSSMSIRYNGSSITNFNYNPIPGDYDQRFASIVTTADSFTLSSDNINITYNYNKTQNEAAAWIDFFTLALPRQMNVYDNQQIIRTNRNNLSGDLLYSFGNFNSSHRLWNLSNRNFPEIQSTYIDGASTSFISQNVDPKNPPTYIIFNPDVAPLPSFVGSIENQNLHGLTSTDYIMITNPLLLAETNRLADFHRDRGLRVDVFTTTQIYNEFSSGSQDVTGIRDFIKLVYDRGQASGDSLSYVLMFGDASYDYKNIEENNTNLVPIYQSYNSNDPTYSYCSDDYFAILSDDEGYWGTSGKDEDLDVFIGRLPVSNAAEAKIVVDKIIHYHSEASRGDWINTVTFVADDENSNQHIGPSEDMTRSIADVSPEYNVKKIWMDAYEQVSFGSGNKYPKVNEEITKMIGSQGTLIFNYVGHGGENGMAHERVVTRPEIQSWSNYDKLSFYITASCELAKIDNLEIESPGELMLLNPNGGAIGLLATTRVVYIGTNTDLNKKLIESNLLKKTNGKLPSLGEAYLNTRNRDISEPINARCFILLGDPAMRLLSPEHHIITTSINGKNIASVTDTFPDTLKALDVVTISGEIREEINGSTLTSFNGELYPTFYDKPSKYKTLGQDAESFPLEFEEQNRIIYKGNISVVDGKFNFQFIVPKDIAYNVAEGKLSYYAKDGLDHAGGTELTYKIGGTSDSVVSDLKFDDLQLYIDDESWVFGGITSTTPTLLATLLDSNGINTVGSGIGREMEAIIDEGTDNEQSLVLNDFYRPNLNSYQSGKIKYPFEPLNAGRHTVSLKVWDVYNNSADAYTEFVVAEGADIAVDNLLNYPNPFNNFTEFHFDHNKAGQNITANIIVSTIAGNVVKSLTSEIPNSSSHSSDIKWDGRDDCGDKLARGVYLYTIKVKAEDGSSQTKTEKLYIIN